MKKRNVKMCRMLTLWHEPSELVFTFFLSYFYVSSGAHNMDSILYEGIAN